MRIFSTEQLGPKQSLTPEGYLLCSAVPIARTGSQLYGSHELPNLVPGLDGFITVVREESEVFSPATMASFEGKSVTVGHAFVDPDSWSVLTKGTIQNVRRGDGIEAEPDLLVADLLITDAGTIGIVRVELDEKGRPLPGQTVLREVSCGYDADYMQDGPGIAFQRNIIGNHVALVERGRAGPRCSIQDGEPTMSTKTPAPLLRRLLNAMKTGDVALIKRTADSADDEVAAEEKRVADEEAEAEKKKTADTIAGLQKTVDELVATLKAKDSMGPDAGQSSSAAPVTTGTNPVADEEDPSDEEKTKTADALRGVLTRAEMLVPGFKMPTTDSVRRSADVDGLVRKILTDASAQVAPLLAGRTVDALTAVEAQTVLVAASEMARARNNRPGLNFGTATQDSSSKALTPSDINQRNAQYWAERQSH